MVYVRSNIPDSVAGIDRLIGDWVDSVCAAMVPALQAQVARAAVHACRAHTATAPVDNGEAISRCVAVADILAELDLDHETLIAALLHDLPPDDPHAPLPALAKAYGDRVAHLIDGVRRMGAIEELYEAPLDARRQLQNAENLRKLLLAMAEDVRVVLIKLADRLHTMRRLPQLDDEVRRQAVAQATMEIYAPLANRLGVWQIKWELEDLAFRHLDPLAYRQIATYLDERRVDREAFIHEVIERLLQALEGTGIEARISGRPKHLYSIWRKMQRKGLAFHQVYDARAVRVLVDTVPQCYTVLGLVHTLWKPIPREFDDYIAAPKENLYQSIHTAVVGPHGKVFEVQIRTHEMHEHAEKGVAAHWVYKEGGRHDPAFEQKVAWMRQLLEWKEEEAGSAGDFIDRFKSEIFQDRIYVLTPQGEVIDMALGATPLDFAYHIHTEVGHRCRGARVNGRIVPLTHELRSGDQVDIITARQGSPSRDWLTPDLGFLRTSRARAKVRHWFRQQDRGRSLSEGRAIVERELDRLGVDNIALDRLAQQMRYTTPEGLFEAVGRAEITPAQIATALRQLGGGRRTPDAAEAELRTARPSTAGRDEVTIVGVGDLLTQPARCCKPVPGDPVVGYITRGRGVTIHRRDCPNLLNLDGERRARLIEAEWGRRNESGSWPVDIEVISFDRQALLRDITAVLATERVNVLGAQTESDRRDHTARMRLTLELSDLDQLSRVLGRIGQLPNVIEARRLR